MTPFTDEGEEYEDGGSAETEDEDVQDEEGQERRETKLPTKPSRREIEKHNKTHIPYR